MATINQKLKLKPITCHIFLIYGRNNGKFPFSHSILILDEDIVLIDTGCGIRILRDIKKNYNIDYIINSHTHPDHSAGNWLFRKTPVYVPKEGFETSGNMVALSERFVSKELASVWRKFVRKEMHFKNHKPNYSYDERTKFNFGETKLEPIYTPGHTVDHYCFFDKKERILFSFDYDLTSFPWYGHEESSLIEFKKSVEKLMALRPKIVVSSHRELIDKNIRQEFRNFLKVIEDRNKRILLLLDEGKSIDELVRYAPIYGKYPYAKQLLIYWEKQMVKKHLEMLEMEGKVKKKGGKYVRAKK